MTSGVKRTWGMTRRGSLVPGDTVANEGLVHEVENGKYTHEVMLRIGDREMEKYDRPEIVYAFSETKPKLLEEM